MNPLSNPTFAKQLTEVFWWVLPEFSLIAVACLLFLLAMLKPSRLLSFMVAMLGWAATFSVALFVSVEPTWTGDEMYSAMIHPTPLAYFIRYLALAAGLAYIALGWSETSKENAAEYYACLMVLISGLSLVARANDLISLFIALEMISIPTYVLLYIPAKTKPASEGALKYFLLSVLSSGLLLFGFSYLYGLTNTTNIPLILNILTDTASSSGVSPLALLAIVFVIAGLAFRLAAVPFHFYAPDVYQVAPTGVVAQLAYVPKVAGMIALARLLGLGQSEIPFSTSNTLIPLVLWVIAAITMTLGNLLALLQDNLKRIFAYSGIAHTGYMMIGVLVACSVPDSDREPVQFGLDALLFYLVTYGMMTVGALAVIMSISRQNQPVESVDDLAGLSKTHPLSAMMLSLFLFSLIGLPLTAGFAGKLFLFFQGLSAPTSSTMQSLYQVIVVIAAINAAIAAVYYLRVIGVIYLRTALEPRERRGLSPAWVISLAFAIGTLAIGIYPQPLLDQTRIAVGQIPQVASGPPSTVSNP